ncbi:YckD family protein [Bacillus glycinifermentans]|uniref:YckD family protein n=1 Tax=Bacillus glycinifermentans TaxID=1664069 RepID=UPI0022E3FE50|nr:YckD family protein [Bacillus glycinifermentans]
MRKLWLSLLVIAPLSFFVPLSEAHGETRVYQDLTEQQKSELASMQRDIMEKKKQLINKYVEYGIIDQERGKEIKSHIEQRYDKEKKNGFMSKWHQDKEKKFHKHHMP